MHLSTSAASRDLFPRKVQNGPLRLFCAFLALSGAIPDSEKADDVPIAPKVEKLLLHMAMDAPMPP